MSNLLTAYGLVFRNEDPNRLLLPFVPVDDGAADVDVTLRLGDVPEELPGAHMANNCWQAAPGRFLFRDAPVGRFLAEDGALITVAPAPYATNEDLTLYLLGSVIAALLKLRGFVTFHASAIALNGQAVVFAGRSGAGKSTLLAELMRRGHIALADDVAAVRLAADDNLIVTPGYPRTRLWQETIDAFTHLHSGQALGPVRHTLPKFILPVENFSVAPARLRTVYLLTGMPGETEQLVGADIVNTLQQFCFRRRTIRPLGVQVEHFRAFARIAQSVDVEMLPRPGPGFSVAAMADQIEARLGQAAPLPA